MNRSGKVAPLVGAWIEIVLKASVNTKEWVAPLVGAWIEIFIVLELSQSNIVAPLVGAWIEIYWNYQRYRQYRSLLSWERGLKYLQLY